jgi:hypothetical protein
VQFRRIVPVPELRRYLPDARLGKGDDGTAPVFRRRPGGLAEQVIEDAAYLLAQDSGVDGIALGGFQIARDLAPTGAVGRTYVVRVFQLRPPSPFHSEGVCAREGLSDHDVAVALEALDV